MWMNLLVMFAPMIITALLVGTPLVLIIKSLHKLLDDFVAALADDKIDTAELKQIIADGKELGFSVVSLLKIVIKEKGGVK